MNYTQHNTAFYSNFRRAVSSNSFIVASLTPGGGFSTSITPAIHSTRAEAEAEASRLARANPGKDFIVLMLVSGRKVESLVSY